MKSRHGIRAAASALILLGTVGSQAWAQDAIKIGVVLDSSGPEVYLAKKVNEGLELYTKLHGDTVAGKKIVLIYRDPATRPDVAKRMGEELITQDNVDILIGFMLTPEALAFAPVATQAKKPTLLMLAATSGVTGKSPYMARLSYTLAQVAAPLGAWAPKHGITSAFAIVADYGPGYDAEAAFSKAFIANGGQMVGGVKVPLGNIDFSPFVQRARDANPKAVFAFTQANETAIAFMKSYADLGLKAAGIQLLTTGDVLVDDLLDAIGDPALGAISSFHYSVAHKSPQNEAFNKAFAEAYGADELPDALTVQAYDTMAVIYQIAAKLGGTIDADKFMAELKGFKLDSPRGPITIDATTRDVDQAVYLRKVERRGNHLYNVELEKIENDLTSAQ